MPQVEVSRTIVFDAPGGPGLLRGVGRGQPRPRPTGHCRTDLHRTPGTPRSTTEGGTNLQDEDRHRRHRRDRERLLQALPGQAVPQRRPGVADRDRGQPPDDLRCHRRLQHLDELQAKARDVNQRVLDTERSGRVVSLRSQPLSGSRYLPSPRTAGGHTGVVPPPCGRGSNPGINGCANAHSSSGTNPRDRSSTTRNDHDPALRQKLVAVTGGAAGQGRRGPGAADHADPGRSLSLSTEHGRGGDLIEVGAAMVSAQLAEELADVADEQVGGLHGGEVAAATEFGPAHDSFQLHRPSCCKHGRRFRQCRVPGRRTRHPRRSQVLAIVGPYAAGLGSLQRICWLRLPACRCRCRHRRRFLSSSGAAGALLRE